MFETPQLLFILLALFSVFLSTLLGFGSALILLAFGTFVFPLKETVAIASIVFLTATITKSLLFRGHINWPYTIRLSLIAIPFTIVGALLLPAAPETLLRYTLAGMIIVYLLISYTGNLRIPPNNQFLYAVGGLYGFFTGIIGTGGIVKAAYFNYIKMEKREFVATMAATAIVLNIIKIPLYARAGLLTLQQLPLIVALILAAVAGAYLGKFALTKLNQFYFHLLVDLFLIISAFELVLG